VVPESAADEGKISLFEDRPLATTGMKGGEGSLPVDPDMFPRLALDDEEKTQAHPKPAPPSRFSLAEGEELLPPEPGQAAPAAAKKETTSQGPAPAPPPARDDDDDDGGAYNLLAPHELPADEIAKMLPRPDLDEEEEEEEDEEKEAKKAEEEEAFKKKRPVGKTVVDQDKWRVVEGGLVYLAIGMFIALGAFFFHRLVVVIGGFAPMEYATIASNELVYEDEPPDVGHSRSLDRTDFAVGLVAGDSFAGLAAWLWRVALLLTLVQTIVTFIGYFFCRAVPAGPGTKRLPVVGLSVAGASFVIVFFFKFLPMARLYNFTMMPFLAPEVGMLQANAGRLDAILVTWSGAPLLEMFFSLLFHLLLLAEPLLIGMFLRAVSLYLKIESLQQTSEGVIRLSLGTAFVWLAYLLLMNAGTSEVLLLTLRAVYLLGTGFLFGLLLWLPFVLLRSRVSIEKLLKVGWVA
jgi:hypothetical protein